MKRSDTSDGEWALGGKHRMEYTMLNYKAVQRNFYNVMLPQKHNNKNF